jgi:hypothetical protein
MWHLSAEVSLPRWINGSNSTLLDEAGVSSGLNQLSSYVREVTEERFFVSEMFVIRVDFTKDFQIGEENTVPIIRQLSNIRLPRMNTILINNSTVYFQPPGKNLNRRIEVYSKYRESLYNDSDKAELASGVLRLEVSHRTTQSVNQLVKRFGLESKKAYDVLTASAAALVHNDTIERLDLYRQLELKEYSFDLLIERFGLKDGMELKYLENVFSGMVLISMN